MARRNAIELLCEMANICETKEEYLKLMEKHFTKMVDMSLDSYEARCNGLSDKSRLAKLESKSLAFLFALEGDLQDLARDKACGREL